MTYWPNPLDNEFPEKFTEEKAREIKDLWVAEDSDDVLRRRTEIYLSFNDESLTWEQLAERADGFLAGLEKGRRERDEAAERLIDYAEHTNRCILAHWSAGEPTADGGYRQKFGDKWYQSKPVDETPKCNCGLEEALAPFQKPEVKP